MAAYVINDMEVVAPTLHEDTRNSRLPKRYVRSHRIRKSSSRKARSLAGQAPGRGPCRAVPWH